MKKILLYLFSALVLGNLTFSGCAHKKGPMEKAGASIDDAFDEDGPMEKVGESIDKAGDKD
ncbi:MAG: hypothetical protein K1X66_08715 [Verrucomicrobiae bacterium]|nr:hypothetical protein [Verrucomicrobiae bacterium]